MPTPVAVMPTFLYMEQIFAACTVVVVFQRARTAILAFVRQGKLPWQGLTAKTREAHMEKIRKSKTEEVRPVKSH